MNVESEICCDERGFQGVKMANRYPLQQPQVQPRNDLSVRNNVPSAYPRQRPGIWPHHAAQHLEEQNEKQREYLKQQQKLRLMAATSAPQSVSADALIENLLGKKETFKPKTTHPSVQTASQASGQSIMVPGLMPGHLGTPVIPAVGYPVPPTITQIPTGPTSSGMIGGFSSSVIPPEVRLPYTPIASAAAPTQFAVNLPTWLSPTSPLFPQLYRQVWKMVGQDKGMVDTSRIFPLLLTSGLPTDVLGYIWGLANRKVAGQLTEEELYIVLALVALAQSGCTFNNLGILNLIPQPPIPNLKIVNFESVGVVPIRDVESSVVSDQGKMKREDLNLNQFSSPISNSTIPVSDPDDAGFDEFTDFQSAATIVPEPSQIINNKDNIPFPKPDSQNSDIAVTTLSSSSSTTSALDIIGESSTAKCPSVMVVSTGHGRGIGSRLANHSLGTPKQKKSKHHHHRHHHHHSQPQVTPNIPLSVDEEFSEFQQAKDPAKSTVDGSVEEVFPKCLPKSAPQGKTYLLKESAIRSEIKLDAPTLLTKSSSAAVALGNFEDKVEREKSEILSEPHSDKQNIVPEIENKLLKDLKTEGVNLMNVEEDKYSALRNLSVTNQDTVPDKPKAFPVEEHPSVSDDFGDFLSAEPAHITNDSFADIATRERVQSTNIMDISNSNAWKVESPQVAEFEVDDWGDFKDAMSDSAALSNKVPDVTVNKGNVSEDSDISSAFMNLDLHGNISWNRGISQSNASVLGKEKLQVFPSLSETTGDLNLDGSWDLKFKDESSSQNNIDLNLTEDTRQTNTFQGFLGKIYNDSKPDVDNVKEDMFCSSPDSRLRDRSDNFNIDIQAQDIENDDDDFGEFVGPDAWTEDQKYNAITKDMLFDGHLGTGLRDGFYGDTQSVSSLELPPLALSRHGSVPSLDLKIFPSTTERNGGNGGNQHRNMSPQVIDHQINEWQRCLESCLTLLQSAVENFNNISSEQVLDEVIGSAEGKDYLQNILEVAGISNRIECSYKHLANSGEYRKLDSLLVDINIAWSSLEQYYTKADISMSLDVPVEETSYETSACCGVCLIDVYIAKTNNNRNTSQLEYGGHVYHSVCANLWVNCVDSSLPSLSFENSSFL